MIPQPVHQTAEELDRAVHHGVQHAKHTARDVRGRAHDVARELTQSEPVVAAESMIGSVFSSLGNMASATWSSLLRFGSEHTHLSSAAIIWMILSAIPVAVFAAFTTGLLVTTIGIACVFLVPINGAALLFSGPTLLFGLFITTILAGTTYFWLFTAGLFVNTLRRIFPSTPVQRIDEGIASKY